MSNRSRRITTLQGRSKEINQKSEQKNKTKQKKRVYKAWRTGQVDVPHGKPEFLKEIIECGRGSIWRDRG